MKKRLLCFTMLLTVTISAITFTNNVKAATKWNTSKSVTKEENGIKYSERYQVFCIFDRRW